VYGPIILLHLSYIRPFFCDVFHTASIIARQSTAVIPNLVASKFGFQRSTRRISIKKVPSPVLVDLVMAETAPKADANTHNNAPARSPSVGFNLGRYSSSNTRINEILEVGKFFLCMSVQVSYRVRHGFMRSITRRNSESGRGSPTSCLFLLVRHARAYSYHSQACMCLFGLSSPYNWWRSFYQLPADLPPFDIASNCLAEYCVLISLPSSSSSQRTMLILQKTHSVYTGANNTLLSLIERS
jgi:hypothetical protein